MGVDSVEILQDALPLLPAPAMLRAELGGALKGFVSAHGALYPVLMLTEFSRFVAARNRPAARAHPA